MLLLLMVSTAPAPAALYSLRDLGPLTDVTGRTDSGPKKISARGVVTGVNALAGSYRAFLYGGAWTNLGTLGGSESIAAGVNDSGQVAGYSISSIGLMRGFLWTPGGTDGVPGNPQMKDLESIIEATSQAYAINNQGQISGYSDVVEKSKLEQHAVRWQNGTVTDIGALLSVPNSFGYGINQSGHIAGTAYNASYATASAFLYSGSSATDIGGLGGGDASALALNDSDQVTGYAVTSKGFDHAFRYSGGTMKDLGTLGGNYSYGLDINNGGAIVGGSFIDSNDTVYHAFIWSNNVMQDLNALLDATGAGWVLIEATAINELGQIVGSGTYLGRRRAFLLYPAAWNAVPRIAAAELRGTSMVIEFTTFYGGLYSVEAAGVPAGAGWTTVAADVPGTGNTVEVQIPASANHPCRFFRIRRTSPIW